MTLKQGKVHQTWYELQDPEQGYNYAKFERSPKNSVRQKVNVICLISKHVNYLHWISARVKKLWYVHYWLEVLNNPTKFQLNWIRTQTFQLKLFSTAVTWKYGQGDWNWHEQVKLNESYHCAKFELFMVSVKVFDRQRHLIYQNMLIISLEITPKPHK